MPSLCPKAQAPNSHDFGIQSESGFCGKATSLHPDRSRGFPPLHPFTNKDSSEWNGAWIRQMADPTHSKPVAQTRLECGLELWSRALEDLSRYYAKQYSKQDLGP